MKDKKYNTLKCYLWSLPSLILILLIVIFPIIYTGYISLTNMNVYHWTNYSFIGLKNYKDAILVFDSGFLKAFVMTVIWTVTSMILQLVIAYILASLLNVRGLKARNIYKTFLIFPWAMPGYDSEVIMAAGAFVQGSSIELSADGPMREPYAVYYQGGLTFPHAKLGVMMSMQKMAEKGLMKFE